MNKIELISKIKESRAHLETQIQRVRDDQKELLILHGEWSIKDLIGHLGFWENRIVTLFDLLKTGKIPEPFSNLDELNLQALQDARRRTFADVQREERVAYANILALVGSASDQELFDLDHFVWTGGTSFAEIIGDNTWGHYDEHVLEVTAWLNRIA